MMTADLPAPVRAALPAEPWGLPFQLHFTLYRNAEQWAFLTAVVHPDRMVNLTMQPGRFAADYVRLDLSPVEGDPRPGWINLRARVVYNGQTLGDGIYTQPLTIYVAEPTDWPSGLARFGEMQGWPESRDPALRDPGVWTLAVRRAS
jgi:hypothetical protein